MNLRLPAEAARAFLGRSVPMRLEITAEQGRRVADAGPVARQSEKSTFYVPR